MKLNKDVTCSMLQGVIEWYLDDLTKEQKEALSKYEQDKTDELQYAIAMAFKLAKEMLESRLNGLSKD